jgi:DNA-binding NarL/FixJ family response regulator
VIDERTCYHGGVAVQTGRKGLVVVTDNAMMVGAIRAGLEESRAFELLGYLDPRKASAVAIVNTGAEVVLVDEADDPEQAMALTRAIRDEREQLAIVFLAIAMDEGRVERAFAAGASSAISKAIHPSALATFLVEALNGHIVHSHVVAGSRPEGSAGFSDGRSPLTDRELAILRLVAAGATNQEIAQQLWITRQTVKFHLANVYRKLGLSNRTEACHYAHVNGMMATVAPEAARSVVGAATV